MERERSIVIDSYQITPKTIEAAYKEAKYSNKSHLVLAETFRMMNLNKLYQSNPGDQSAKYAIKSIVDSAFLPRIADETIFKTSFDLTELFPLNKMGNFGRVLNRKCKLAEKGIMEYSDDQNSKLKEIKAFVNRVQTIGSAGNDSKIEWYEQSTKYPYRIILIDANDGHKAIYFPTLEKAQKIRIVLSQQYLFRGNFGKLIHRVNQKYKLSVADIFKNKLVSRHKMISKSNRFSRKVQLTKDFAQQSRFNRGDPSASVFQKERGGNFHSMINSSAQSSDMLRISNLIKTKPIDQYFDKANEGYINDMLTSWLQKAKIKASSLNHNLSPIQNETYSRVNPNPSQSIYKSRIDNLNDKSSKKQESIFNRLAQGNGSTFRKSEFKQRESYVKQFGKDYTDEYGELECYSIDFLTLTNLFFKPIVTVELIRNNRVQQHILYNTVIKKKDPILSYDLVKSKEEEDHSCLKLNASLKEYDIFVKVIDFLANEEVLNDKITMKDMRILSKSRITGDNKMVRLEFGPKMEKSNQKLEEVVQEPLKGELKVPPVSEAVREKVNQYWERESQLQGYYNETNLSIFRILSQIQVLPLTWWKGYSEEEYQLLQVVYSASKILGFKMIRSFPHIIRVFVALYHNVQQLTEKLLSFIITFLKPYYSPQYLNKIQRFHRILGLTEDCQLISKVNFQILVIQKIVQLQCPALEDKLSRSNVCYGYQMIEYIYQAFSRNLTPNGLVELWNHLYEDLELLQLNMILFSVSFIKQYEEDLINVKRLTDFRRVLESKKIFKVHHLIGSVAELKEKYFGQVRGLLDEIKNIFNSKPLEPLLQQFYKKESAKMDMRKSKRLLQKKSALRKVNKQVDIQFPQYANQNYTLHIYFSRIPEVGGSLIIRCNDIDYECLSHDKNRYFIIGQVHSTLSLVFLDMKSNQYICELVLNQGIQEHTALLKSVKSSSIHKVSYIGALLTESQIQIFKRGKKIDHFISPFIKEADFTQQMSRPIHETYFLRKYDSGSSKDDLIKRIKGLFCPGNKTFNQIEFYIEHIETSDLTIEEKLYLVRLLAWQFSRQFCLCKNEILQKHFIRRYLESTGFDLSSKQYECFYNDSLQFQFDAPKILKCRYYPANQPTKELKLQIPALQYYLNKCSSYLYCDIIIDDLIQAIKPWISEQLGGFFEGELKLYYSSNGEVFLKSWQLKLKNNKKQVYFQQIKEATAEDLQVREIGDPEVLMTEVLPSFAKISTILDYVNSNRQVDLKHKYQDKDRRKVAENINILKDCEGKFAKAIIMRHQTYPKKFHFPFFNYYYELTHDFSVPSIKNIVLNNLKSDLKAVCLFGGQLKFGENAKVEAFTFRDELGLYGNLRLMSKEAKSWFFFGSIKDDFEAQKQFARVFVNYGYGIFRWQPCQILGYYKREKNNKTSSKSTTSPQKPKKEYLIVHRNQQKTVKEYELEVGLESLAKIEEIVDSGSSQLRNERSYDNDEQEPMGGNLKYLSKFIK